MRLTVFSGLLLAAVLSAAGCAERGEFRFATAEPSASSREQIFVATPRKALADNPLAFGAERAEELSFLRYEVSIPAGHKTGQVEWAKDKLDPARHFFVTDAERFASLGRFVEAVSNRLVGPKREVVVAVHGYNTNLAEGTFRLAQVTHDFDSDLPHVLYSWPSAADPRGYIYDRDSTVYSRDGLERLLEALAASPVERILLTGHSMGTYLVTETLRQMSIRGNSRVFSKLSGVLLVSPDIDIEIFKAQVARIKPMPQPFALFVSKDDKALKLSAKLTGKQTRLGNVTALDDLAGLKVAVVDVTELGDGTALNHAIPATSPEAIAIVSSLLKHRDDPGMQASADNGFWRDKIEAVGRSVRIVLKPGVAAAMPQ